MEYGLVLLWLSMYVGLGALALPATAWLFDRVPGRGAGFALPVALATVGVVGYWVGQVRFGYPALAAALVVLAALSGVALYRGVRPDPREYGTAMAVFAVAFGLLVAIRAVDPAVHPGGGEKFLDFGLLNSLLRTGQLPPEDIWFAGDAMPYYYGGHMITALLAKLTGTAPRYAYNLALAGWYGAFVTAAYALAGAVAGRLDYNRRSAGVFAAFAVGIASNLVTPMRLLAWAFPGGRAVAGAVGVDLTGLAEGPDAFEYWSAHVVIPGTNNEFPFFAFLNGDMHAHMMSPTFLLLLAGALLAYWSAPDDAVWRKRAVLFLVAPPLVGLIALVNTWSLPTTAGLTFLALAFAPGDPHGVLPGPVRRPLDRIATVAPRADGGTRTGDADPGPDPGPDSTEAVGETLAPGPLVRREAVRVGTAVALAAVVAGVGALVVFPYLTATTSGRGVGFVENRSGLWKLLLVHGGFLGVTAAYLLPRLDPGEGHRVRTLALVGLLGGILYFADLLAVFPFVVTLAAGWLLVRTDDDVDFETALAVGALGLVVLVEFVRVTNAGPGRYNTVFKVYAQVWALWATAVGVMLAKYVDPVGHLRRVYDADRDLPSARPTYAGVFVAVLVASLSLYAGLATVGHFEGPHPGPEGATLDGVAFVETDHPDEAEAIRWVRDLEGQPNIATAPTACMYRWTTRPVQCGADRRIVGGSAPSSLTGVPTLAGWYHEIGYRGEEPFLDRVREVRTLFSGTPAEQARILSEYNVEYVYVGPAERDRYRNIAFAKRLTGVEVAHESGAVTIYRVDPDAVAPAGAAVAEPGDWADADGTDGEGSPRIRFDPTDGQAGPGGQAGDGRTVDPEGWTDGGDNDTAESGYLRGITAR